MDRVVFDKKTVENIELLRESCSYLPLSDDEIQIFQHFYCPISIVEADVKEYVIDEYDSVELLVLRLYDAGLRTSRQISNLVGIDENMIEKILMTEKYTFGHINPETGEITKAGRATLDENTDINNLFQHALYSVKREMQVDSITGTLIKANAEKLKSKMATFNEKMNPKALPRRSVEIDGELLREIRERLQLYIDNGYFSDGNTINNIEHIHTREVRYRDAYFVKLNGFDYPFIALPYLYREGDAVKQFVEPICLARTDYMKIQENEGAELCLVREDSYLNYLDSLLDEFEELISEDNDTMESDLEEMITAEEDEGETEEVIKEIHSKENSLEEAFSEGANDD